MQVIKNKENKEILREMVHLGVETGRSRQSEETGFVHLSHSEEAEQWHTIPVVENLLFTLLLFRTRTLDNIQEGKLLLQKLLPFQERGEGSENFGNFPVYLHQFPMCKDYYLPVRLLPIFYWLLKEFRHVIEQPLRGEIEEALKRLVLFSKRQYQKESFPYHLALIQGGAFLAIGQLIDDKELQREGEELLGELRNTPNVTTLNIPRRIGDLIVGLQMAYPKISETAWKPIWEGLLRNWDRKRETHIGLPLKEYQFADGPEVTLLDLFFCSLDKKLPKRIVKNSAVLLQTALLRLVADKESVSFSEKEEKYALALVDTTRKDGVKDGLLALRLLWGEEEKCHSFVLPRGNYDVQQKRVEGGVDLRITLPDDVNLDSKRHNHEIAFYSNLSSGEPILVEGKRATTFQIGQRLSLCSEGVKISLTFKNSSGEGRFFGHLMRGNRPSQIATKGKNRFDVYDHVISIRSVDRPKFSTLEVEVRIEE